MKEINKIKEMLEWAKTIGVRPLPLHTTNHKQKRNGEWYGGKQPMGDGWGLRDHTAEEFVYKHPKGEFGRAWLQNGLMRNVGLQLGPASKGLIDIDLDSDEAIDRAAEFFGDLKPVQYGRGGVRTHMLLRVSDVGEDISAKYTGMMGKGKDEYTGIELRTGYGKTKDGDPEQLQSMVIGIHPDTGEELGWIGEPPERFEDFPTEPFSKILERFAALCDAIGARKVWVRDLPQRVAITRRQFDDTDFVERVRSALPPLSVIAAEYAGDTPGRGNQQCPVCQNGGNPVLSVDDDTGLAYCFWDGCDTRALGSRGGFDVFHLVSHMEGFSDFSDCLEFLAKRVGVKYTKPKSKSVKKKQETSEEKRLKIETAAGEVARKHIFLHGDLYTSFDGKAWVPATDHQLRLKLRKSFDDLYNEYVSPFLMSELETISKEFSTPPADSPDVCPPENYGCSVNLQTGEVLTGTAFQDVVVNISDVGDVEISDRSLDELYVNPLPHSFPLEESATPMWSQFLEEFAEGVVGNDRKEKDALIATIHTMIGACIFDNRMERFWLLYGRGGSGKGIIFRILRAIVGARNWYSTTMQAASSRFIVANMRNKKIIALPEMEYRPWKGEDEYNRCMDVFKRITGRDPVGVEVKFIQFAFDAVISGNVVASSNSLTAFPRDGEEGTAWGRRLIVIPTPPPIREEDQDFSLAAKIISSELAGIIRAGVDFYADALRDGRVPLCARSVELREEATSSRWSLFSSMFEVGTDDDIVFNSELRGIVAEYLELDEYKVKQGHTSQAKKALRDVFNAETPDAPIWNWRANKTERGIRGVKIKVEESNEVYDFE